MLRTGLFASVIGLVSLSLPGLAASVDVVVQGGSNDLRDDLRDDLRAASVSAQTINEGITDGQELLAAAQADYRRMVAALYEAGHFAGVVSIKVDGREAGTLNVLGPVPRVDRIVIAVDPGPRYRFAEARIAPLPQGARPVDGFAAGGIAKTPIMREAAQQGVSDWRARGHAKARVGDQQITALHPQTAIRARIDLAPGPKLRFGRTLMSASSARSKVRSERVRAIAGLPEGEVFSPDAVTLAERRLRRTGAFRSAVVTEADAPGADDTLDMIVAVEDAKPRRFGFGVELSSIEGAAVTAYWLHRNLLGGAERFRVDGFVSGYNGDVDGIDYGLTFALTRPAFRHPDMNLRFAAVLEHRDEPAYRSNLIEATMGVERFIGEDLTLEADIGIRLAHVNDAYGARNFNHLIGRVGATLDRRNNDLDPTKGYYLAGEAKPFLGVQGSESGARVTADMRGYLPLGDEGFALAGRVQAGSVVGASLSGIPPEYLFFSGGGGTVRGQDYKSLGGAVVAGEQVGGRSFLGLSTELRAKLSDRFGLVGFVDYGYVAADTQFTSGTWHGGAGIGARYYTPIGPLRVDVAVPVTGETGFGVYVGIGQSF